MNRIKSPGPRTGWCISALILLACIVVAGCTFHGISSHAGTRVIPPSYGVNDGRLAVHFIDVGQGDSALILYDNTTVLIDAGEADAGPRVVSYLKRQGVSDIDILIATHPHSDHIGGMQDVFKNFNVHRVIDSGIPYTTPTYRKFLQTIDQKNIPYSTVRRGDSFTRPPAWPYLSCRHRMGAKMRTRTTVQSCSGRHTAG